MSSLVHRAPRYPGDDVVFQACRSPHGRYRWRPGAEVGEHIVVLPAGDNRIQRRADKRRGRLLQDVRPAVLSRPGSRTFEKHSPQIAAALPVAGDDGDVTVAVALLHKLDDPCGGQLILFAAGRSPPELYTLPPVGKGRIRAPRTGFFSM